jgi:transcriptional regulator with XRE-family HTH domain
MSTGNRIQERRNALGLSQTELAQKLTAKGIPSDKQKVSRIETGKTRLLADELPVYARVLKTTVEELLA